MTDIKKTPSWMRRIFLENFEFFLIVVAVGAMLSNSYFHVVESLSAVIDLDLTVLTLLTFAVLRQRLQLKDLHETVKAISSNMLYDVYPDSYLSSLEKAKVLWITGTNLRRLVVDHEKLLKDFVKEGGKIRAILLSRNPCAINYAAQQDSGYDADSNNFLSTIKKAENVLNELKNSGKPNQVIIKRTDYPLPFGLDAVDIETEDKGIIYVRFYPFHTGDSDKPILVLKAHQSKWYAFYKKQLEIQWEHYATH